MRIVQFTVAVIAMMAAQSAAVNLEAEPVFSGAAGEKTVSAPVKDDGEGSTGWVAARIAERGGRAQPKTKAKKTVDEPAPPKMGEDGWVKARTRATDGTKLGPKRKAGGAVATNKAEILAKLAAKKKAAAQEGEDDDDWASIPGL